MSLMLFAYHVKDPILKKLIAASDRVFWALLRTGCCEAGWSISIFAMPPCAENNIHYLP